MRKILISAIFSIIASGSISMANSQSNQASEAAELLFLVKPEHKKELIADGILSASVFSSAATPEVIVVNATTDLSITLFQEQGKVEVVAKCFYGSADAASELLKKLVSNANKAAGTATDLVKTIVSNSEVTIVYDQLDSSDIMSEKRFEISQCKSTVSTEIITLDPIVRKYAMCTPILVQLPDSIATGILNLQASKLSTEAKLAGLKDLFATLKSDKSVASYCSVVSALSHKGKVAEHKALCEEALVSKELIIKELLDLPLTPARKRESLCAVSTIVNMMVFGF